MEDNEEKITGDKLDSIQKADTDRPSLVVFFAVESLRWGFIAFVLFILGSFTYSLFEQLLSFFK